MQPQFLYKYRNWDDEYHKRLITHNEIFFSSIKYFNDPFDSTVTARFDMGTEEQYFASALRIIEREYPSLTPKKQKRKAYQKFNEKKFKYPENIEWQKKNMRQVIEERFGVFSLTESEDNIVMWSHYADSHKGFCVGFDYNKLFDLENIMFSEMHDINLGLYKVEYHKEYPLLNWFELDNEGKTIKVLKIKSYQWEYEKEYRLILLSDPVKKTILNRKMILSEGIIAKVILGCRMRLEHKQAIIEALQKKQKNIQLSEAKTKDKSFGLDFEEMNY